MEAYLDHKQDAMLIYNDYSQVSTENDGVCTIQAS